MNEPLILTPTIYQDCAERTLLDKPLRQLSDHEIMVAWCALGLAGEAGEFADLIKKMIFHGHEVKLEKLILELGDVQWYISALASKLGVPLDMVMRRNLAKLDRRYPDGFNQEASKARIDQAESK